MKEFFIQAGESIANIGKIEVDKVYLKGLRRPHPMRFIEPADFKRLEKEQYAFLARGVPEYYTVFDIDDGTQEIAVLPRPTGGMTIIVTQPMESLSDGLDTTWQRTNSRNG